MIYKYILIFLNPSIWNMMLNNSINDNDNSYERAYKKMLKHKKKKICCFPGYIYYIYNYKFYLYICEFFL